MHIENLLFDIAEALKYPVLIAAILALAYAIFEIGVMLAELYKRRGRGIERLDNAIAYTRHFLAIGDNQNALNTVHALGYNERMSEALDALILQRPYADREDRIAKRLAEYDYASLKRLERTRILVRMGPALGLMGTLIPLSPALAALSNGDVQRLTNDLRVAFSVTVTGLLIGMLAFIVSLVRDRLYAQDFSDVEYVAAALSEVPVPPAAHAHTEAGSVAAGA
ncbi:MAG: MotA/TolQ/ExbB proton channel family protein [Solirubrobacterales bacterium]